MKYLQTFEGREQKRTDYHYLSKEDSLILENFVIRYIEDLNILNKAKNLKLEDFEKYDFNYNEIYMLLINANANYNPNSFNKSQGNIYYQIDKFNSDNKYYWKTLHLRNSLDSIFDSIHKMYIKNGLNKNINERLIKIFEKNIEYYRELNVFDRESLTLTVQNACEWIITGEKYNL